MNDGKNEFKVVLKGPWVPCMHCGPSTPWPCTQLQFYFFTVWCYCTAHCELWPPCTRMSVTSCSMLKWLIL